MSIACPSWRFSLERSNYSTGKQKYKPHVGYDIIQVKNDMFSRKPNLGFCI